MINAFSELTSYSGHEWDDFLTKCSLIEIFKPVLERYPGPTVRRGVITYIVRAYSMQSNDIVIGMEWGINKTRIFEKADLPEDMHDELVLFENIYDTTTADQLQKVEKYLDINAIRVTIIRWLEFQDSQAFMQLSVLKDLQVEMQRSAVNVIKKSSGEVDYDQKFKNAKYAMDLRILIKDIEDELIQNSDKLKEAVQEVKKGKTKTTFGLESFIVK